HARRGLGSGLVDRADIGMGMRREEEHAMRLARQIDIGDVASPPGQETRIFLARDRLSNPECHLPFLPFFAARGARSDGILARRAPQRKAGWIEAVRVRRL